MLYIARGGVQLLQSLLDQGLLQSHCQYSLEVSDTNHLDMLCNIHLSFQILTLRSQLNLKHQPIHLEEDSSQQLIKSHHLQIPTTQLG